MYSSTYITYNVNKGFFKNIICISFDVTQMDQGIKYCKIHVVYLQYNQSPHAVSIPLKSTITLNNISL